ncbi:MAG TPA: sulfite exporter TauE/SafE family protein [Bryobacteraceae bacterium]|nr:sulfite exporter TauE/SafE family protein [Bryobacteraceae bacterium]
MEYVLGFLIATAVGLTGVGAGSLTAPILILFFHSAPAAAVGTALAFASAIKLSVMPLYLRRRQVHFRTLLLLCAGGVPGVLAGFYLIRLLDARKHESVLFLLLGSTIVIMALYNLYRSTRSRGELLNRDRSRWLPLIAAGIGTEVGFSSAGAGALGSLVLLNFTPLSPAQVIGTDMFFGLVVSTVGGGFHLSAGHYDAAMLTRLVIGGIAGAFAGANLSAILPSRPLRIGLSLWLASMGAELCWRAL